MEGNDAADHRHRRAHHPHPRKRRPPGSVSRHQLWRTVSVELGSLLSFVGGPGAPSPHSRPGEPETAERCRMQLWQWVRNAVVLTDGGRIDRQLVEALVEAEAALLVFAGELPGRVGEARRLFQEVVLGPGHPRSLTTDRRL